MIQEKQDRNDPAFFFSAFLLPIHSHTGNRLFHYK